MKSILFALLVLPLIIACGEEKYDPALNGTWEGEVVSAGQNGAVAEVVIYKFNKENLTTYKTKKDTIKNEVEVEVGTYNNDDNKIIYNISAHSCTNTELGKNPRQLIRTMTYKLSPDQNTVDISVKLGTRIRLKKLTDDEAKEIDDFAAVATTGCFDGTSFKQEKIQKPGQEQSVKEQMEEQFEELKASEKELEELEEAE
jgi:hypothetical protein